MEVGNVLALGLGLESPWKLSGQRLDIGRRSSGYRPPLGGSTDPASSFLRISRQT
jgi:hypothetical protein